MRFLGVTRSSTAATTPSSAGPRGGAAAGRASVAVILVLSVLAIFFARAMPAAVQFLHRDTGRAHEPMKRYVAAEIAQGRFPEWNPFSGLGSPLVAGAIDAVQHPFNLLLLLPFALGFKLWVLLSYALAATGAMAWARVLGRSVPASIGAGLAFGISGFLVGQSNNLTYLTAYAGIPWVFACARVWFERGSPGALALLGLSSALVAAAGDPQGWGIALLLVPVLGPGGPLASAQPPGTVVRRTLVGILAGGVAAAPFVLPVLAWLPHSERAIPQFLPQAIQRWNLHPWRLAELAIPNLFWSDLGAALNPVFTAYAGNEWTGYPWVPSVYVGAACLALAVVGSTTSRFARLLIVGAIVATWAATGPHLGFWALARHVPVLQGFRYWEKIAIWATLFLSVGAAFGVDAAASRARSARLLRMVAAVAGAIAWGLCAVLWAAPGAVEALLARDGMPGAAEGLVANARAGLFHAGVVWTLLAVLAVAVESGRLGKLAAGALALSLVLDPFLANREAYALSPANISREGDLAARLRLDPDHQRILVPFGPIRDRWPELSPTDNLTRWWARTLESPWNVPARVGNLRSYAGMHQDRMYRYEMATSFAPRIGAGIWGFSSILVPDRPGSIGTLPVAPPYRVVAVDDELPATLVEIPHRPRVHLAEAIVSSDQDGALGFVLDDRAVASPVVVLEGPVPAGWSRPSGQVRLQEDLPGRTVVDVVTDRRALLVLNDAFAPGWRASVDGIPAEILAVNLLARGVWVDAGAHRVTFEYRTPLLSAGWALLGAGLLALLGWAGARRWSRGIGRPARP